MNAFSFQRRRDRLGGFTLIELLVVIAIIAVLTAMMLPCLSKAKSRVRMVEELSAGRQLMLAVQLYADDRGGAMFPGYAADPTAVDDQGKPVGFPTNARYPWRIAPYVGKSMPLIYSGENRKKLAQLRSRAHADYVYGVSVYPSLGINSYFVGGNEVEFPAAMANARFGSGTVITRIDDTRRPSDQMVFISARSAVDGQAAQGYFQVLPPSLRTRQWASQYTPSLTPKEWGFVAPRFGRRAVAAMIDGHAASLDLAAMQDMRRWCNNADRADFVFAP